MNYILIFDFVCPSVFLAASVTSNTSQLSLMSVRKMLVRFVFGCGSCPKFTLSHWRRQTAPSLQGVHTLVGSIGTFFVRDVTLVKWSKKNSLKESVNSPTRELPQPVGEHPEFQIRTTPSRA